MDLTQPDLYRKDGSLKVRKGMVHIFRTIVLWQGHCYQHLCLRNYDSQAVSFELKLAFEADFYDVFEVRGAHSAQRGEYLPTESEGQMLSLGYRGLDGSVRKTRIRFSQVPQWCDGGVALLACHLAPGVAYNLYLSIGCDIDDQAAPLVSYDDALQAHRAMLLTRREVQTEIYTSNEQFNDWLNRSGAMH